MNASSGKITAVKHGITVVQLLDEYNVENTYNIHCVVAPIKYLYVAPPFLQLSVNNKTEVCQSSFPPNGVYL